MKTCVKCGKKGLFLWLSKNGYCESCAIIIREEQQKAEKEAMIAQEKQFDETYIEAARLYSDLPKCKYSISADDIPHVEENLHTYERLIAHLDTNCRNDAFLERFKTLGKYESNRTGRTRNWEVYYFTT